MADLYRPFYGHEWLNNPISLTGGTLRLSRESEARSANPGVLTREGRKAKVYKAYRNDASVAMKVFHRTYALPINIVTTGQLARLRSMDGLRVCERQVIDQVEAERLGVPGLAFAILMPWIDGEPWSAIVEQRRALNQLTCLTLARRTAAVLAGLEARGLAHADVSSTNLIVSNLGPQTDVQLIDVEDMYHPTFVDVPNVPDGTPGYNHPANRGRGCRNPAGDRFAAAILLAEMLVWHQPAVRNSGFSESFFDSRELCRPGPKYRIVREALAAHSPAIAALFAQAWNSNGLTGCPTLAQWRDALTSARLTSVTIRASMSLPRAPVAPRLQTTFIPANLCAECGQLVDARTPTDHATTCSHHPRRFKPEFDYSSRLTTRPVSPAPSADLVNLLQSYSARLTKCEGCGKLVIGPDDEAHTPQCPVREPVARGVAAVPSGSRLNSLLRKLWR